MNEKQLQHVRRAGEREDRREAFRVYKEHGIPIKDTLETLTLQRREMEKLRPKRGPRVLQYEEGTPVPHHKGMNKAVLLMLRRTDWVRRRVECSRALPAMLARYQLPVMGNPHDVDAYFEWRYKILQALRYRRGVERARPQADLRTQYDLEVVLMILMKSTSHQISVMLHTDRQREVWRQAARKESLAASGAAE